jgi:hypothetical protein
MEDEFDWGGWPQTKAACVPPEWLADDDEPVGGYSLMRELAEKPGSDLVELAPGVWYQSKLRS